MDIKSITQYLSAYDGAEIRIMEVCGTHTAAIFKNGIRSLLSPKIRLISGPGCPVCVTPAAYIDRCIDVSKRENHVLMSFGDMLKVPGKNGSLSSAKGEGAKVSLMYSPLEALEKASAEPNTVFTVAAVGFETTVPAYAVLIAEAKARGLENIKLITALKTVIPALRQVAEPGDIDGFICPGHVSVISGSGIYAKLAAEYNRPFVIAGFEGAHILAAVYAIVRQTEARRNFLTNDIKPTDSRLKSETESDRCRMENLYPSAVRPEGNLKAQAAIEECFERGAAMWRGLGIIANSGYYLKDEFAHFDAGSKGLDEDNALPEGCRCGDVIVGTIDPADCPMFGSACTPANPCGPCMVSAEGACGIWYQSYY